MKANHSKCYLLLSASEPLSIQIDRAVINSSQSEKLPGVHFDNKLKFDTHINTICQKTNRKLNVLAGLTPYMDLSKKYILMNAFSIPSLITAPLSRCFIVVSVITRIIYYTNDASELFITIKSGTTFKSR